MTDSFFIPRRTAPNENISKIKAGSIPTFPRNQWCNHLTQPAQLLLPHRCIKIEKRFTVSRRPLCTINGCSTGKITVNQKQGCSVIKLDTCFCFIIMLMLLHGWPCPYAGLNGPSRASDLSVISFHVLPFLSGVLWLVQLPPTVQKQVVGGYVNWWL